jgi:hypothetical protein
LHTLTENRIFRFLSERFSRNGRNHPVLFPFLLTRLGLLITGVLAIHLGAVHPRGWRISEYSWIDLWARWDSGHYLEIARSGYSYVPGEPSNVVFFPLYPLLMRWLTLGSQDKLVLVLAGWIIANACTLLALFLLYRMVREDEGESLARRTLWCLLLFPTSFYFSMVYNEGLFLVLSVGAFYLTRKRNWWGASLCTLLAGATRVQGVGLVLPLFYLGWRDRVSWRKGLMLLTCCLLGLGAFMAFLYARSADPLLFVHATSAWGRAFSSAGLQQNLNRLVELIDTPELRWRLFNVGKDLGFTLVGLILLAGLWDKKRMEYFLYSCLLMALPLSSFALVSIPRYLALIFPFYVVLARRLDKDLWRWLIWGISTFLQLLFMVLWSLWYWVA